MKVLFLTVIWGKNYIEGFINYSLPTQMSQNNLQNFYFSDSTYLILTDKKHFPEIESQPIIKRLSKLLTVAFCDISHIKFADKYQRVSVAQLHGLRYSKDFDCVFFIYPDFLCGDGVLLKNALKMSEGWDAIMCPVPAVLDSIYKESSLGPELPENHHASLPPEKLVELSFRYFHPFVNGYNLDKEENSMKNPVYIIRTIHQTGLLIQAFHLHPIAIRVQQENPYYLYKFDVSLDEEYVTMLFKTKQNIYFPKTIDEFAYCSVRTFDSPPNPVNESFEFRLIQQWAEFGASKLHRQLIKESFYWGTKIKNEEHTKTLDKAKNTNSEMIERALNRLNMSDAVLQIEDEHAFVGRQARRERFKRNIDPQFLTFNPVEDLITPYKETRHNENLGLKEKLFNRLKRITNL